MMNKPITILLVDDEARFLHTCKRLLTSRGYNVITADNGISALEILSLNHVDLMLLDLKMPVMGGDEVLEMARRRYPSVPIIILTGHGTMDKALTCLKKGAYDFISKPFDTSQLLIAIRSVIEKWKQEEEESLILDDISRLLLHLNTEKKRLRTIIDCMASGVMVTNRDLKVILHNPALMRLMDISEKLDHPAHVSKIINDHDFMETLKQIQGLEYPETEIISQEIHRGDKYLRAISTSILGPDRRVFWSVVGSVTIFDDITAFKQLDRMKTDFVNMVAHELRSPLVAIRQLNSVLAEGLAGKLEKKQKGLAIRGIKKIDALLDLINDLLDMAKMEAGRYIQQRVPTDISRIIKEIVLFMEPRADEQGVTITYSCHNLKPIQVDPKNILEIFNNLITNAINYSPEGGRLTITATGLGDHIEIKVDDTGVGIPPEELDKIFDKFYRVKHPKTRNVTGTGLGLTLVKEVVEAYQGSIDVESVLDKGTTFRIQLPIIT